MNRAPGVAVVAALAFVVGCGGGKTSPANDAAETEASTEASIDLSVAGDDAPADSNPGDGATPVPCPAAGPPIEAVCSGYCSNLATACTGANSQFASNAACIEACIAPTWSCGTPTETTGNTIFCRISHAMAATMAPDTECPQAGPQSASCI